MNDWKKKAVVYEAYVQSFKDSNNDGIGDLPGLTSKLDYIKNLGANVIWLTPIFKSPLVDNGYDISDYEAINPIYGTMSDFDHLLNEVHKKGLKIVLDLVVNHTSDKHKWFRESKKSCNNKYSDYYIWRDPKSDGSAPTNLGSAFGGSAWEYVPERKQYYLHLFAKQQPDLNWDNPKLRQSVYKMMRFWLDKGVDGFRMDSISFISKPKEFKDAPLQDHKKYGAYYYGSANGPHIHEYLQEMNREVLSKYDILAIGETPHTTPEEAEKFVSTDRHELDMVFQFEHMHVDYGEFGRYSDVTFKLSDLRNSMSSWQNKVSWNSIYLGNHDQPRIVSRFGNDNKYQKESAEMLAMIELLQKGTPFIFQGEEIGMTNLHVNGIDELKDLEAHNIYQFFLNQGIDKETALKMVNRKTRDNARTPMQWNNTTNAGFSNGKPWIEINPNYKQINVEKDLQNKNSIYKFYQKILELKKNNSILIDGKYKLITPEDSAIYGFTRTLGNKQILVVGSFVPYKVKYDLPKELVRKGKQLLCNYDKHRNSLPSELFLKPYEGIVFQLE
ncbi:glycoside hydrolase family 13 protein [Lactobacillus helveticus]|uniref:Oligo-1,6-glucosidase n=1 Tax=Lactobacillus helveticus TaxID=1587 RepID=A0A8H9KIV3_LACHE|nr:alpha-glucosidase [Lactobacillus helveticus]MBW8061825.1 alpha-glucosidase [Lactobacillus helveticus]GFO99934.1 oligo-1,6-glucosidase [Lactobacillus helveticus]GFP00359.1 oligo-1,6-glucosidase [Lactobacillus helveticus]GFP03722.1 oligo-1,6-glucosidase [Lactobacillus helveticus]GFP04100.1 oligo-1,6-glucosidase [Lactobacillus helveticus]